MQNWHRQFLGRTQMPPTLSGFVINEFFTLRHAELQAVLSRYGVDMRIGAAVDFNILCQFRRGSPRSPAEVVGHQSSTGPMVRKGKK